MVLDIKHTYRYVIITSAGHRGDLWFGESDKGKCLGLGGDCHVKQDPVHGSGVLQLDLPLQCLHILLQSVGEKSAQNVKSISERSMH